MRRKKPAPKPPSSRPPRALREMEGQFQLSKRLEAVGQLADGVAHEFNNQLGVIFGYADLLRSSELMGEAERRKLDQITKAAQHSAAVAHQLLAFARKQHLEPTLLSPSNLVAEAAPLLSQLLGADVEITLRLNAQGRVRVDPRQLASILMDLVTNARDAMPGGGTLSIETADADLTQDAGERHESMRPARYVMLRVGDTGSGLDPATKARIFEPFFSTKPHGRGAGLGLAAVYGTVKQSGGYLFVDDNPERGTSFQIYLPLEETADAA